MVHHGEGIATCSSAAPARVIFADSGGEIAVSKFSEVFQVSAPRIESSMALAAPVRSLPAIFDAAEKNPGLDVEDAASLVAWARTPERREEIHRAARQVRDRLAPPTVEFVIPV